MLYIQYYPFGVNVSEGYNFAGIHEKKYRFHLNHTYWVEGYQPLTVQKNPIYDLLKIGIVGHNEAIDEIMWSVFEPQKLFLKTRQELDLQHPRGIILYGPPGTGKSSMIRGICNYQGIAPNVIHVADLLNPSIGNSEANLRQLFLKPMAEQNHGNDRPLHVIVLDDMDALFPKRSNHGGETNTRNTVVSHILSMMDGYRPIENYVIFGTANRLYMIDPALLLSGRFELHIEIDMPNKQRRLDILNFHIEPLRMSRRLAPDEDEALLCEIANTSINYSGADLEQLVQRASELAIGRIIPSSEIDSNGEDYTDEAKIVVCRSDIIRAYHAFNHQRFLLEKETGGKD